MSFQLTRPVRVATHLIFFFFIGKYVSTHATRAGRDSLEVNMLENLKSFNSRDPCGSRLDVSRSAIVELRVSTHATRAGRDIRKRGDGCAFEVSTHATRAGRDLGAVGVVGTLFGFNSRDPCGSRR